VGADKDKSHGGDQHLAGMSDDEPEGTSTTTTTPPPTTTPRTTTTTGPGATKSKKAASKCTTCKSTTCAKGKKCPHFKEFGKPEVPKATLIVPEDARLGVFDLEYDEKKDTVAVNEVGACVRSFRGGAWKKEDEEFKEVTKEKLGQWGRENCVGLDEERKSSKQGFHEVHTKFVEFIKKFRVKHLLAHGVVSSDARVMVKAGHALGIDVMGAWKEAGIQGFVDTMRIIPQYDIKALRHLDGKHVLSNGALFSKATKGETMKDLGLQEHRALDDSKATAEWVTGLPEVAEVMFGQPQRPTAIAIDDMGAYFAQKRKHKAFSEGR